MKRRDVKVWAKRLSHSPCYYLHWYCPISQREQRESTGTEDPDEAQLLVAKKIMELAQPVQAPVAEVYLRDVLYVYKTQHSDHLASGKNQAGYLRKLAEFFGEITVNDLDQFVPVKVALEQGFPPNTKWRDTFAIVRLDEGVKENTVNRQLVTLRAALNYAVKHVNMIDRAPFIKMLAEDFYEGDWLTEDEIRRLRAASEVPHLDLYLDLALGTLSRPGAILELTWDQVDLDGRTINLNPPGRKQTKKRRPRVPMPDWLVPILRDAYDNRESEYVITFRGEPVSSVKRSFSNALRKAGVNKKITPNSLRHTGATHMAQRGVALFEIAKLLGHSSTKMVEKYYAHHHPDHMSASKAVLNSLGR